MTEGAGVGDCSTPGGSIPVRPMYGPIQPGASDSTVARNPEVPGAGPRPELRGAGAVVEVDGVLLEACTCAAVESGDSSTCDTEPLTDGALGTGVDGLEFASGELGIVSSEGAPFWMFVASCIPVRRAGRLGEVPEALGTAALTEPRSELPPCGKEATPDAPT